MSGSLTASRFSKAPCRVTIASRVAIGQLAVGIPAPRQLPGTPRSSQLLDDGEPEPVLQASFWLSKSPYKWSYRGYELVYNKQNRLAIGGSGLRHTHIPRACHPRKPHTIPTGKGANQDGDCLSGLDVFVSWWLKGEGGLGGDGAIPARSARCNRAQAKARGVECAPGHLQRQDWHGGKIIRWRGGALSCEGGHTAQHQGGSPH